MCPLNARSQPLEHSLHQLLELSLLQPLGPNQRLHLVQLPPHPLVEALVDLVQLQQPSGKLQVRLPSTAAPCVLFAKYSSAFCLTV